MRILVADDDKLARMFFEAALTNEGHQVEAYEDGEALWEAFAANPARVIVSDWMMPRATGIEVCQRIRESMPNPYTHFIVVTSLSPSENAVQAYRSGADDLIGKPVEAAALARRVAVAERGILAETDAGLRKSLEVCQATLGADHEALLGTLGELAAVSRQQRAYARCRAFLRRQLAIAKEAYGDEDPRTRKLASELEEMNALREQVP